MACEVCGRAGQEALRRTPSGLPTLGLGLSSASDAAALAQRAEEAGFAALWVPSGTLADVAKTTGRIAIVAIVDVSLSPDIEPTLPVPAELAGRLAYAVRFTDPPLTARLSARACRRAGAAAMRKVHGFATKADTPVLIQGSCHESLEWIAERAEAWAYDRARLACVPTLLTEWRRVAGDKPFIQMLAEGPGLDDRVDALVRDGVDHIVVMMSGGIGSPGLWRLPRRLDAAENAAS